MVENQSENYPIVERPSQEKYPLLRVAKGPVM
jgi:hypothetical protein